MGRWIMGGACVPAIQPSSCLSTSSEVTETNGKIRQWPQDDRCCRASRKAAAGTSTSKPSCHRLTFQKVYSISQVINMIYGATMTARETTKGVGQLLPRGDAIRCFLLCLQSCNHAAVNPVILHWGQSGPSPLRSFLSCSSRPPSSSLQEVTSSQPGLNCSNLETELLTSPSVKGEHSQQYLYGLPFWEARGLRWRAGPCGGLSKAHSSAKWHRGAELSKDCPLRPRKGMTHAESRSWWAS